MMTPGLAFFYGSLVSKKNVVNTMLSVFAITAVAIILFIAFGYEMCFNGDNLGIAGHIRHLFLSGVDLNKITLKDQGISSATYLLFEMMFAIITPALFVGATVSLFATKTVNGQICLKWTLGSGIKLFMVQRVAACDEQIDLDLSEHGEFADAQVSESGLFSAK